MYVVEGFLDLCYSFWNAIVETFDVIEKLYAKIKLRKPQVTLTLFDFFVLLKELTSSSSSSF